MTLLTVSIGADPEVFVLRDGCVISGIGLVPGSKEQPHRTEHGWVQPDNVLAEYNIPPQLTREGFIAANRSVLQDLGALLGEHGCTYAVQASHEYTKKELRSFGRDAMRFGCEPDYNAWTGDINPRPMAGLLRTAGGHVHIGSEIAKQRPLDVIKACDVLLGLPSILADDDNRRRGVYGKAGAFRYKPYGVEYRSLSNYWLLNDSLIGWVFDQAQRALQELDALVAFADTRSVEIQEAINTSNKALAYSLMQDANV